MKKQLTYAAVIAVCILAGFAGVVATNNAGANSDSGASSSGLLGTGVSEFSDTHKLDEKNETVYVITDASGTVKSTFIGSTLYDGSEKLPFEEKVSYYLDGTEVTAAELVGKSGRVKIVYRYDATATYQGKKVPFVAMTGVSLDSKKFSNVRVTNGKVVSEGENYLIVGYGMPGLSEDLGVELLPDEFIVEADATDFALGATYTVLANDLIAEVDTTKLNDVDGLIGAVNRLADGMEQLASGGNKLSEGLEKLLGGAKELYSGATALATGVNAAATGADELASGLETLSGHNAELVAGAAAVFNSLINTANKTLNSDAALTGAIAMYGESFGLSLPIELTINNYSDELDKLVAFVTFLHGDISELTALRDSLDGYASFYYGLIGYTDGVTAAANGTGELASGLDTINAKIPTLVSGLGSLVDGATELYQGSVALKDGLTTFKTTGIDKLVVIANGDLANLTLNVRRTVAAAAAYRNFGGTGAESVKFIVKTAGVK